MTEKDKDMQANGQPEAEGFQDINSDENMSGSTHLNDAVPEENELDKVRS